MSQCFLVGWTAARFTPTDDPVDYITDIDLMHGEDIMHAQERMIDFVHEEHGDDYQVVAIRAVSWEDLLEAADPELFAAVVGRVPPRR